MRDVLVGAFAVRELVNFAKSALDTADSVAKTADMLGLSTDTLQQYQAAATLSGIQTENFSRSLRTFVAYLGQARTGTGTLATYLKKTDQAFLNQVIATKSTDEALQLVINRLAETKNAADRAALAYAAFGGRGVSLVNMLRDGAKGLEEMKKRAVDFGLVLDSNIIRAAEGINDRMFMLRKSFENAFTTSLVKQFASSLQLTKDNFAAMQQIGNNVGRVVGASLAALASAAAFVGKYLREIVTALAAFAAMRAATMFGEAAIAIVEFGIAVAKAAKALILFDTTAGKTVVGTLLKIAAAILAATVTWYSFSGELKKADKLIADMTGNLHSHASSIRENTSAVKKAIEKNQEAEKNWKSLTAALGEGDRAYQNMQAAIKMVTEANRLGLKANTKMGDAFMASAMKAYEAKRAHDDLKNAMQASAEAGKQFGNTIGSAFVDAATSGKSLGDVIKGLTQDLEKWALQLAVVKPLESAFSSVFKGSGFITGIINSLVGSKSALGNVFSGGNLVPFASGGLITGPTVFPMANGKAALTAEAGGEAALSLRRIRT